MNKGELIEKYEMVKLLDWGHVRLVDVMGDDAAIVQAARCSYGKGTRPTSEDRGLIRYLTRMRHTSPLEMCEIKLHCKMPIFVARQWIRHRTANVNEISGRYSEMREEFYVPAPAHMAKQSSSNKQGRGEIFPANEAAQLILQMGDEANDTFTSYQQFLEAGMAKELARINLPLSTYTEWYWKIDLHNLLHFLGLRLDPHAQYEIRVFAEAIWAIVQDWCPLAAEAFVDYQLEAKTFSRQEMNMLHSMIAEWKEDMEALAQSENIDVEQSVGERLRLSMDSFGIDNKRERLELLVKLGLA